MIRRPPRSTQSRSSAASDVYKRQVVYLAGRVVVHPGRSLPARVSGVVVFEYYHYVTHAHVAFIRGRARVKHYGTSKSCVHVVRETLVVAQLAGMAGSLVKEYVSNAVPGFVLVYLRLHCAGSSRTVAGVYITQHFHACRLGRIYVGGVACVA